MDKAKLYQSVESAKELLIELSDRIWEFAELSMQEYHSADTYVKLLKQEGFHVEEHLVGLPTAFSGSFGCGRPVIGLLGEFDALSGLSQAPGCCERSPLIPGGNGHGCGHNLLGAAALGAAIAIKNEIAAGNLKGTVVFYGCPGEEGCAGKTFMARDGMFKDLDAALTWHPDDVNEVTTGSNAACMQLEYTFSGIAAHAAGNPEHGRSALDAVELMNIGVQFLREHMPKTASVHYSILDAGGVSPNVVQPTAKVLYMVRDKDVKSAKQLLARVNKIADGAALMTETTYVCKQIDGTASTLSNHILEQVLYDNLCAAPLPQYDPEETAYATQIKATCPNTGLPGHRTGQDLSLMNYVAEKTNNGTAALNNFVLPYAPSMRLSPGSTDVGDVSWLTPTAQFTAVTFVSGSPGHSWQNVSTGRTSIAHKGLLYAAKVLAGAAADLMENPDLLEKAKNEFAVSAADGYDCPITADVKPIPVW